MSRSLVLISTLAAMVLCTSPAPTLSSDTREDLVKRGDELFREGKFAQAEEVYERVLAAHPSNGRATMRLGELALLGNRFEGAKRYLKKAIELLPADKKPKMLLAEAYYRQDDYEHAAPLFRAAGREPVADQLESFKRVTPHDIVGKSDITRIKFVQTDPLPIVQARVNDKYNIYLLIDTGAAALILDPEFADEAGATRFGKTIGTFAGGKQAAVQHAKIDSIQLGEFSIKNVPVALLPTRRFPFAVDGQRIDGILGTVLFYHFFTTLDYPNGELVLRRKADHNRQELETFAQSKGTHVVPFWMAGSHWIVAWGEVNQRERCLLHVDTGLAGGGFTCPKSTLKAAGIDLAGLPSFEGMGGGGPVKVTPFEVDELALGDATQQKIQGLFGGQPSSGEYRQGFRIGGIISHGFFRPYALTFDFERMKLLLTQED